MVHALHDGVEASLSSIGTTVHVSVSLLGLFLVVTALGFWLPYGSVCWLVPAYARPTISVAAATLSPLGCASSRCLWLLFAPGGFGVVSWGS